MAETIGAIASIIGIAGAGAKLSIILFDFASTVGSAGLEVRQIGTEIALFCSVLRQLQSTLTKAKGFRYSISAIETTQQILDQCQDIFKQIEDIVNGLRKPGTNSNEPSVDLVAKVKWVFKRSKVVMLRTTLESCKITLHIMLTTLDFAQKISTRRKESLFADIDFLANTWLRLSTIETEREDEQDQTVAQSLIIAHQHTIDTLERLEEEDEEQQAEIRRLSPRISLSTPSHPERASPMQAHRFSRSYDSRAIQELMDYASQQNKRASVVMNDLVLGDMSLSVDLRRQSRRDSMALLDRQPSILLRKWTDQGDRFKELYESRGERLAMLEAALKTVNARILLDAREQKLAKYTGDLDRYANDPPNVADGVVGKLNSPDVPDLFLGSGRKPTDEGTSDNSSGNGGQR
jgi:hypothetical protein